MCVALKIGSWNLCNGLSNKVGYIRALLVEHDLDILLLQEAEIQVHKMDLSLLQIGGFSIEISNSTCTSRVVMYIRNSISYTRRVESVDTNLICVQLQGNYAFNQIVGVYRPFKLVNTGSHRQQFKSQLNQITDYITNSKKLLLLGDFNLDYKKLAVQNYPHRVLYDELLEMIYAFDLCQQVNECTWSRVYNGIVRTSLLDHVYVGDNALIKGILVDKQPISDHCAIIVKTWAVGERRKKIKYEYTCWKNYSKEKLIQELNNYDFTALRNSESQQIADALDIILGTVRDKLLSTCSVTKKIKDGNLPVHILEMKKKLRNMYRRAKSTKNKELLKKVGSLKSP